MEGNKNNKLVIDLSQIRKELWSKKALFIKVWIITFILSCLWILPQPRYYTASVSISPEASESKELGGLASIASNFGVNIGNGTSDAIYPQLYPDLFESTKFAVSLFDIQVKTADGEIQTDYYTYLEKHQKSNPYMVPFNFVKDWIASLFSKDPLYNDIPSKAGQRFNPFMLSRTSNKVLERLQSKVSCTYSRATDVVTIAVKDQDPLVCATLADSIKERLQIFITDYRTKKARIDLEYYEKLTEEAKVAYDKSRERYASFSDATTNASLRSVELKMESMENEMQSKYNIYTAMSARREAALAKVQENTPAFTEIINATVPIKPAGPKRMIFVAVMLLLATLGTVVKLYHKQLVEWF